jgi:hypothetical protein
MRRAHDFFALRRDTAPDTALLDEYLFECERVIGVVDAYEAVLGGIAQSAKALASGSQDGLIGAAETVKAGLASLDGVMARVEVVKKPYLQPQVLRDLSSLRAYVAGLAAAIEGAGRSQDAAAALSEMLEEVGAAP